MLPMAIESPEGRRDFLQRGRVARMIDAQRLEHAPQAVVQVHAQQDHGDDVEDGDGGILESGDHVGAYVHIAVGPKSCSGSTAPTVRCSTWKTTKAATMGPLQIMVRAA